MTVPPVFIVGSPRSGTTLMRLMLTAHPNVSISSEGAHIYHIAANFSRFVTGDDKEEGMRALHDDLMPWLEKVKFLGIPTLEELTQWVNRNGSSLRSLITFYGTWEARVLGKERLAWWGDNAPYHVHIIPLFNALFPESRFIVLVRDPRDTCASGKRNLPWRDFERRVAVWEQSLLNGLVAAATLGPKRVITIKYEELVSAPEQAIRHVADFLELAYSDEMLSYHTSAAARAIAELDHHRNVVRPVFATSIGRYREVLTREEIDMIETRLFTPMFQLGYLSYREYRQALYRTTKMEPEAE